MNHIVFSYAALSLALSALFRVGAGYGALKIKLFKNDFAPSHASVLADFTEATFAGYVPVNIAQADWAAPAVVAGAMTTLLSKSVNYTSTDTTPQTVYGWFAVTDPGNLLVMSERFDNARSMVSGAVLYLDPFSIQADDILP